MSKNYCTSQLEALELSNANGAGLKAARLGDVGSGHGCFPPTPIIKGSPDVFINHRPAARLGDAVLLHGCGNCPPHGRSISAGSDNVFINNKKATRVGDSIDCGGSVSTGSGNVFIGEAGVNGMEQACLKASKASGAAFVQVSPITVPPFDKAPDCAPCQLEALAGAQQSEAPTAPLDPKLQRNKA